MGSFLFTCASYLPAINTTVGLFFYAFLAYIVIYGVSWICGRQPFDIPNEKPEINLSPDEDKKQEEDKRKKMD
jgi:hypothetical protein